MRKCRRRRHGRCSIYAPCRAADLAAVWEAFKNAVDDPATRDLTIAREWARIRGRRDLDGNRY